MGRCEACQRESDDLLHGFCPACRAEMDADAAERDAADIEAMENDPDYGPEDDMDGDHASALASCGWGVDEDYGGYGGEEW